jgi:hypothetical protein
MPAIALAQVGGSFDPCAVYPKNAVTVPLATATGAIAAGVAGKTIYVCSVTTTGIGASGATTAATPGLELWYGTATTATATPCGTNSPFAIATLGWFGGQGTITTTGANGGTLMVVPAGAQLCGQYIGLGTVIQSAIVTYVQIKQ